MGLSSAERQRRYMKRLKARAKTGGDVDRLKARWEAERATLKAEIAALKASRRTGAAGRRGSRSRPGAG